MVDDFNADFLFVFVKCDPNVGGALRIILDHIRKQLFDRKGDGISVFVRDVIESIKLIKKFKDERQRANLTPKTSHHEFTLPPSEFILTCAPQIIRESLTIGNRPNASENFSIKKGQSEVLKGS